MQDTTTPAKLEAAASLHIRLLGPFQVHVNGAPVAEKQWARPKPKLLLKLLALQPNRQMHREQLMEALWPEQDPEQAARNLHRALHIARRALEPDLTAAGESLFLSVQDKQVRLHAPGELWIDLPAFERAAETALAGQDAAAYEAALALYRGELLAEDLYEDWAVTRREQVRALQRKLLGELARLHEKQGRPEQSIERFNELLAGEPADEAAHRQLMRLYALTGKRHQALQQYRQCCEALRRELDAEPEPATAKLHAQILGGQLEPLPQFTTSISSPLVVEPASAPAVAPTPDADDRPAPAHVNAPTLAAAAPAVHTPTNAGVLQTSQRWRTAYLISALGVLALLAGGYAVLMRRSVTIDSIAVLPLVNADPQLDYLSDGLTDNIINGLSPLPGLRVMARNTVFRYKDKRQADAQAVGRELGVQAVLVGHLTQQGDRLVIQTELVKVADGTQIWGDQYRRPAADLLAVQIEIARNISENLRLRLSGSDRQRLTKRPTENAEAYQHYLKGLHYLNVWVPDGVRKTLAEFEQALALDPNFAPAYAGLANIHALSGSEQGSYSEAAAAARAAALKALELDETLAEAHTALGLIKHRYDWDAPGAEQSFQRALALNPNAAATRHWRALNLEVLGRLDEAVTEMNQAQALDPVSQIIGLDVAGVLLAARRPDEAFAQYRKILEMDPNAMLPHMRLGHALTVQNRLPEALAELQQAATLARDNAAVLTRLAAAYALADRQTEARTLLTDLENRNGKDRPSPAYLGLIYFRLSQHGQALKWLEQAYQERDPLIFYFATFDPAAAALRADARYAALLQSVRGR
mgnify:CR=1 FL=1